MLVCLCLQVCKGVFLWETLIVVKIGVSGEIKRDRSVNDLPPLPLACKTSPLALLKGTDPSSPWFTVCKDFDASDMLCFNCGGALPEASPVFSLYP